MFHDPYRIVTFGLIGSLVLLAGLLCNKYMYPKKQINYLLLLILIAILPILSIFRPGVYESGDFRVHIYEAISFFDNLTQGNLLPRWGGELNATYGYPVFLFAYPLPNYLISLPHFFGVSFIFSLKLFLAFSFIASGIAMYFFAKQYLKEKNAFVAAIFYLFAPFHFVDLHFRVDIGEVLSFVFFADLLSLY